MNRAQTAEHAGFLMHASRSMESVRPRSNDERRAEWAARFYMAGNHRRPHKPRIRVTEPKSN